MSRPRATTGATRSSSTATVPRSKRSEDGIRLFTKNGFDWTARYRYLAEEAATTDAETFIFEGETIMINEAGLSDFHAMQAVIGLRRPSPDIYLVAFDLLYINGQDLREMPVEDRREILQEMIPAGGRIQVSEALPGTGAAVYRLVDQARDGVEAQGQCPPQRTDDELAQDHVLRREGDGHRRRAARAWQGGGTSAHG
jgi:hypothetical protein